MRLSSWHPNALYPLPPVLHPPPLQSCFRHSGLCLYFPCRFDWSQLTTVAWNEDPALMCAAHAAGARVVLDGRGANPAAVYGNRTARRAWLDAQVQRAVAEHLDGINFDLVGLAGQVGRPQPVEQPSDC